MLCYMYFTMIVNIEGKETSPAQSNTHHVPDAMGNSGQMTQRFANPTRQLFSFFFFYLKIFFLCMYVFLLEKESTKWGRGRGEGEGETLKRTLRQSKETEAGLDPMTPRP